MASLMIIVAWTPVQHLKTSFQGHNVFTTIDGGGTTELPAFSRIVHVSRIYWNNISLRSTPAQSQESAGNGALNCVGVDPLHRAFPLGFLDKGRSLGYTGVDCWLQTAVKPLCEPNISPTDSKLQPCRHDWTALTVIVL